MDIFRKPSSGEPFRPSARQQGAFIDAARDVQTLQRQLSGLKDRFTNPAIVQVRNDTGQDLTSDHPVVGLGGALADPVIAPEDRESVVHETPTLSGVTPSVLHRGKFAVLLGPLANGAIGPAIVMGATWVRLQVDENVTGDRADVDPNDNTRLLAGDAGAGRILWREGGEGEQWALVRLGNENPENGVLLELQDDLYECGLSAEAWLVNPATFERYESLGTISVDPIANQWRGVAFGTQGDDQANRGDFVGLLFDLAGGSDGEHVLGISSTLCGAGNFNLKGMAQPGQPYPLITVCVAPNLYCYCGPPNESGGHHTVGNFCEDPCDSPASEQHREIRFYAVPFDQEDAEDWEPDEPVLVVWAGNRWIAFRPNVLTDVTCGLKIVEEGEGEEEDEGKLRIDPEIAGCGLDWDEDNCRLDVDRDDLLGCGLKEGEGDCDVAVDNGELAGTGLDTEGDCSLRVAQSILDRIDTLEECCATLTEIVSDLIECCEENRDCCEENRQCCDEMRLCCDENRQCCYDNKACCYENRECCYAAYKCCAYLGGRWGECAGRCVWEKTAEGWDLIEPCTQAGCTCPEPTVPGVNPGEIEFTDCVVAT